MGILRVDNIQDRSGNHNSSVLKLLKEGKFYCSVDMRHGTDGTDNSQIQTGETLAMRESYIFLLLLILALAGMKLVSQIQCLIQTMFFLQTHLMM